MTEKKKYHITLETSVPLVQVVEVHATSPQEAFDEAIKRPHNCRLIKENVNKAQRGVHLGKIVNVATGSLELITRG